MAIQIYDNGTNLQIVNGGLSRLILKAHVHEVSVVRETIVRIDLGQGALRDIYVDQLNVNDPFCASAEDLRDQILIMVRGEDIPLLTSMQSSFSSVDKKLFYEPKIIDATIPGLTYKGYADPGKGPAQPAWAIQRITVTEGVTTTLWAEGKKTFDKVWNNRAVYPYL